MKKICILTAIIILHLNSFSQLFDATIDGAIPGTEKEVVAHFQKKGYSIYTDTKYPKEFVFMIGWLKPDEHDSKRYSSMVHLTKEDSSDFVQSIAVYFAPSNKIEFEDHKRRFIEKFGAPASSYKNKAVWQLHFYKYTIGEDEMGVYHELKVNKTL
jgi:hypothetical protein